MRRKAALSAMVMALALAHAVPAEARSVGQSWYRLKEGIVKLTRADAILTQSQRLDNGVLRTHTQYVGGQKRNTLQTFTSANGRERPAMRPVLPRIYRAPRHPMARRSRPAW